MVSSNVCISLLIFSFALTASSISIDRKVSHLDSQIPEGNYDVISYRPCRHGISKDIMLGIKFNVADQGFGFRGCNANRAFDPFKEDGTFKAESWISTLMFCP